MGVSSRLGGTDMTYLISALFLSVGGMYLLAAAMLKASDIDAVELSLEKYRLPGVLGRSVSARRLILGESLLGIVVLLSVLSGSKLAMIGTGLILAMTYLSFALTTARVMWRGDIFVCSCLGFGVEPTAIGRIHVLRALGLSTSALIGSLVAARGFVFELSTTLLTIWIALSGVILTIVWKDIRYLKLANRTPFVLAHASRASLSESSR